jgi:hypothetical protein
MDMHTHVNNLCAELNRLNKKVEKSPDFVVQARVIAYTAGKIITARGYEARFKDRTPFFTPKTTP